MVDPLEHLAGRLKQLRAGRKWSLDALSQAWGVSRSMLSEIERGNVNPTLAVTFAIARAFGMQIGEFLETPHAASNMTVIRRDDHAYHYRSDKNVRIRTLSPLPLEQDVEFYEVTILPGGKLTSAAHYTESTARVPYGRERTRAGDVGARFRGPRPRRFG